MFHPRSQLFGQTILHLLASAVSVVLTFRLSPAVAAEVTWSGNSFPSNWTNGGNWVGGNAPVNGDSLLFTGSNGATNSNDLGFSGVGVTAQLTGITYAAAAS